MKRSITAAALGASAALFASGCMLDAETPVPGAGSDKPGQATRTVGEPEASTAGEDGCFSSDTDCNGRVNFFDIDPFMAMLTGAATGCSACAGDADCSGALDEGDVDPFLATLFDSAAALTPCAPAPRATRCPDGGLRVKAALEVAVLVAQDDNKTANAQINAGNIPSVGQVDFLESADGCKRFKVRIDSGMAAGMHDVMVANIVVGSLMIGSQGSGELEFDTRDDTFPLDFPVVFDGDVVHVGLLSGGLAMDCLMAADNCTESGIVVVPDVSEAPANEVDAVIHAVPDESEAPANSTDAVINAVPDVSQAPPGVKKGGN